MLGMIGPLRGRSATRVHGAGESSDRHAKLFRLVVGVRTLALRCLRC